MERMFLFVSRINSILLLLVLIGAAILIAWMAWAGNQGRNLDQFEVPSGETTSSTKILLRLARVQNVTGTDTQMILLSAEGRPGTFPSVYSGSSETRNVLFLTGSEVKAQWLFTHQNNRILVTEQLREEIKESRDNPTKALYFEYVSSDTNNDGKLSNQDLSNVGLAKPDGLGFTDVLTGVTQVLSNKLLDSQKISVVYQSRNSVRHATFSVSSFKLETDQEIGTVPEDI